jgi:plasmid stabilization system protein ParE
MMRYSLVVNPEAQADLAEAIAYYNDQRDGLGREFANCVDEAFATIRENPQLAAEIYRSARLALVRRFPFLVCYRIVEDEVRIISVFHGRRDSRTWKSRVRKSP